MILGQCVLFLLTRMWFLINGFLNSNGDLMAVLKVIRLDW
jgi:hypothetical protein